MEKHLLRPRPRSDAFALFALLFPLIALLGRTFPTADGSWYFVLLVPVVAFSAQTCFASSTALPEAKSTKRFVRQRPPPFWAFVVRSYLYLTGETAAYSRASHSKKSVFDTSHLPRIRYVGAAYVGILFPEPSSLHFYINGVPWTQVYTSDELRLVVLFGLTENTVYNVRAVCSEAQHEELSFHVCTLGFSAAGSTAASLTAASLAASAGNDDASSTGRPRRREVDAHAEALQSITTVLDEEKARARKHKRDGLKRLASVRHEIDALNTKLATKRKSDERARKRIQVLRDRVAQQKAELETLQSQASAATQMSTRDVAELASKVEAIQRERHSKQQGLDVSVRVWAELQRTKRNDVQKLKQRCTKLDDRIEKIRNETALREATKAELVSSLIRQLREERSLRKQRRVRLEADFRTAIAKLGTV